MTILNIETSTDVCSVAVTYDGMVLCHREDFSGHNHATLLSGFVKDCLDHIAAHEMKLDAVAVSIGPGSYTGLRIGLSEAKGLCYALNIPLIGIDTLKIMAVEVMFTHNIQGDELFVPMIDARRMEVYTAVYNMAFESLVAPTPLILSDEAYDSFLAENKMLFFGNGSDKARQVISSPNATFIQNVHPLAANMLPLAEQAFSRGDFLDLAYSVPLYLKEFQATKPKKLF
ncbi:MAG: tRNA (adenosine(37)-N6)-threonylcarbamoyltransferase complex dimerization subunit type 1 TsaB [Muribaculaceae bacterium]|nr:tRNA (adenosine(37)-N6)-threonylcarbamoyltransferase complex dimerization subunit type 1 TsaB [Muribaculaceae bacterium]